MSLNGLFNQTIDLYTGSVYDEFGREDHSISTSVKCRFQKTSKNRLGPNGSLITIAAVCYVPSDTTIEIDDRITFDSEDYKVYGKYTAIDGAGNTNHIKLELVKWLMAS